MSFSNAEQNSTLKRETKQQLSSFAEEKVEALVADERLEVQSEEAVFLAAAQWAEAQRASEERAAAQRRAAEEGAEGRLLGGTPMLQSRTDVSPTP